MTDLKSALFNKVAAHLAVDSFPELTEKLGSTDGIFSIEIKSFSRTNLPRNFGVYLVYEKKTGDVLYVGSSGSYTSDGLPTKQTLRERLSNGHAPRRFSEKNKFFGLSPKKITQEMEKQKLIDCADAFQKTWELSQISLVIHHWPSEHLLAPRFVERLLLSKHMQSFGCLPQGNKY